MAVPFRPGRLSQEEYEQRKQQCTKEALASLQKSRDFRQWQQRRAFVHSATRGLTMTVVLLLATVGAASYHFLGGSEQPAVPAASGSPQNAEAIQSLGSEQFAAPARAGSPQGDTGAALQRLIGERDELQQQLSRQAQQQHQQQLADLQQRLAQQAQQAAQFEQRAGELQQQLAQQAQQASAYQQQLGALQQELSQERANAAALSGQLSAAEAELGRLRAHNSALEAEAALLRSSAASAGQQPAAPAAQDGELGLSSAQVPLKAAVAGLEGGAAVGGLHRNESAALPDALTAAWLGLASPDFWSGLWVFYMSATMPLLLAALYRWLRPQRGAAGGSSSGGQLSSLVTRLKNARDQVMQLEQEVQSLTVQLEAARAAATASEKEAQQACQAADKAGDQRDRDIATLAAQLEVAEAAASSRAAEAEQARQSLLQVQGELEERLRFVRDAALVKIAEASSGREELEEVHRQLEEQREWQAAAQQLLSFTAPAAPSTATGGASTPIAVRTPTATSGSPAPFHSPRTFLSPVKHSQLAGRVRPSSPMRNASPLRPTPIDSSRHAAGAASGGQSPAPASPRCADSQSAAASISEAAAAAAALEGDSPQGWLALLKARFVAAKEQGAAAERAGVEVALEAARRETSWSQQKVAEMVTDNELLKQRLADAKRLCERAVAGEAQAKEDLAALRARLEEVEHQAGVKQQQPQRQQGPRGSSGVAEGASQLADAGQQESMGPSSSSSGHAEGGSGNSDPQTQAEEAGVTPLPMRQKPQLDVALAEQATPSSNNLSGSKSRVAKLNTADLAAAEMAVELLDEGWWSPGSARDKRDTHSL